MKILIACEFSGIVREAFKEKGHDAWSCDLLPSEIYGKHYQGDVFDIINNGFDMMIAFPPCTYLCNGGANWLNRREGWRENREKAVDFFMCLNNAQIDKIAIENPIGYMSTRYRKPDQIIKPFMFGHEYKKDVCLWNKNLPLLKSTKLIAPPYKKLDFWSDKRHKDGKSLKSITFQGIADAMAEQWG